MADEVVHGEVLRDTYRDSVDLMRVAAEVEQRPGVRRAALLVATAANRELLAKAGLLTDAAAAAQPTDLVVAVAAQSDEAARAALAHATGLLAAGAPLPGGGAAPAGARPPATLAAAAPALPAANLAIVSTPGAYATAEALKALKRGLHVFLFSDNVPLEDEVELKRLAVRKGLLLMGPDCGTALVDGVPLGFANAVRRGRIGLVAASGTGLQHVTCLIDRLGEGVSQAIGVGGRDLDERVGGLMMQAGLARLSADPETAVLVLLSKPPAPAVAARVLDAAVAAGKPAVVCFLGGDAAAIRARGAVPAETLEGAARLAVDLARGRRPAEGGTAGRDPGEAAPTRALAERAGALAARVGPGRWAIRGLYSGGSLCQEAALVVGRLLGDDPGRRGHTLVDLGDDEFTVGRPHPMIDYRLRNEHLAAAAADPATAVILLDVVLGYGSHADPAEALRPVLARIGPGPVVVGSVCGTDADPQGLAGQEARLAAAGVALCPSNAEAARLAALVAREAGGRRG
jgi:FdrA protein